MGSHRCAGCANAIVNIDASTVLCRPAEGYRAFSLPGQFAPRSELASRTLADSLPGQIAPWCFRSLALSFPGHFALPMKPNGQTTWVLCAVECDVRSGRGSIQASARARLPTKKWIISNNSYAHDDQGDNPGQENRGLDGVFYKLWPFVSDRVKWRHISMVEIRSPFCRSRPSYCA